MTVTSISWNLLRRFLTVILCFAFTMPVIVTAETRPKAKASGTSGHYSPDRELMEEGHVRIRKWRKRMAAERQRAIAALEAARPAAKASARRADILQAPVPLGTEHAFAKGMLNGKWMTNRITHTTSGGTGFGPGVRLDRTAYDADRNIIYAITTEYNLAEAPLTQMGSWVQRNQVVQIHPPSFVGLKIPSGGFRLVGSIGGLWRYSDDQGMTWTASAGEGHIKDYVTFSGALGGGQILVIVNRNAASGAVNVLQLSKDYGKSFQDLQAWQEAASTGIVATYLYNTVDHCLVIRGLAGSSAWEVHQFKDGAFSRIATVNAAGGPATLAGTFKGGIKAHLSTRDGALWSTEDGIAWAQRSQERHWLASVHPDRPELVFTFAPTHDYSSDGGRTWVPYPENSFTIGWDPKHLTYYKVNGKWMFVVANDMGLCFNPDPLDASGWRYANDNHTYAILHGGVAVDRAGLTVTANQDPGTFELLRTGRGTYSATNRRTSDGLRVAASNSGKAYWFRHYWEEFMHAHAAPTGDLRQAYFDTPGEWYTPPFKGSTVPGEDAIYVSGHAKLAKLTYSSAGNSITRVDLPFDFQATAGAVTFGVGVAQSDPQRLYVATRNGRFYHSRDAGKTWTETTYSGPKPLPFVDEFDMHSGQSAGLYIEVSDTDPDLVFFGGSGEGPACLISRDGGRTFTAALAGLPSDARIASVSLSPDGKLAFSTDYRVYVASENAWFDLKTASLPTGGLPYARGLNYLPLQRKVRYFTYGAGVVDLDITRLATPDHPDVAFDPAKCYGIASASSGQVLAVTGPAGSQGVGLAAPAGAGQAWQLTRMDGFYRIASTEARRTLEVAGSSQAEAGLVGLGDWADADHQLWNIERVADSSYVLIARHSVKALEASNDKLRQAIWAGQATQRWRITESSGCAVTPIAEAAKPTRPFRLVSTGGGRYRILHADARVFHVRIYDAEGATVRVTGGKDGFDLSGLPGGLYHVKIMADHLFATESVLHPAP